jgi:hypothetical protein
MVNHSYQRPVFPGMIPFITIFQTLMGYINDFFRTSFPKGQTEQVQGVLIGKSEGYQHSVNDFPEHSPQIGLGRSPEIGEIGRPQIGLIFGSPDKFGINPDIWQADIIKILFFKVK